MHRLYALLFLIVLPTHAATLQGTVTGIADGDTLYVLDRDRREHRIRLLGIDAPEHGQPYGEAAKRSLKRFAHRKAVAIEWQERDQYGRVLGKVLVMGEDAGLHQLRTGMAWWNRRYAHEQPDGDAIRYREAEHAARKERLGLWSQRQPLPPWRWRYANPRETDTVKP
jgi:endonuclease YncB( thermonuclease family)